MMSNLPQYYLGADIGGTKTHVLIVDESGQAIGFGEAGPGNHETVGYKGLVRSLRSAFDQALVAAAITREQIAGAGFGVAGYDWPSEEEATLKAIGKLGLQAPLAAVNDTILGLLAGSDKGWGVAVVSGTGCNCWGWDSTRKRVGRVTGGGTAMGEGAGASELVFRAVQSVAQAWTQRGPATALTAAFMRYTGATSPEDLLSGLTAGSFDLDPRVAPLVFQAAESGDGVAVELIRWAALELSELVRAVVHQLQFESLAFDVVLVGSMFDGGSLLVEPFCQAVHSFAPGAELVRLAQPPVTGAVLLGMEQAGVLPTAELRRRLAASYQQTQKIRKAASR
jgi:N-acetylglucosamine kinase-like BadF-type ATPase